MGSYVLIVESDADLQRRIGEVLREARYELAAETELTWARRSLTARRPDAIVLDTALSDGSGFVLAEELRAAAETRATPIIFVASRHRGAAHASEARRRFAPAEYLPVPLDVDSMLAALLQRVPPPLDQKLEGVRDQEKTVVSPAQLADDAQKREKRNVERKARDLAQDPEFRGSLRRVGFARVLRRLYARKASGQLLLLRGTTKKIVSFVDGYPVSVRSSVLGECLGQILLAGNLISKESLAESLRRMKTEKKQQGALLIEMGVLSPFNLQRALVGQMEAKLFDLFSWSDGQFLFKEGAKPPDEPVHLDRSTAELILEGVQRHYDEERLGAVLAEFAGKYVALASDPVLRMQEMTSDPAELSFIYGITGSSKLEALLDGASIERQEARVLLVALAEAGMIRPSATPVRRGGEARARSAAPAPLAPPAAAIERPSEAQGPEMLMVTLDLMRARDPREVLRVSPKASAAEIDAAYEALAREYHADRFRGRSEEMRELAREIFEYLGEAHRSLR